MSLPLFLPLSVPLFFTIPLSLSLFSVSQNLFHSRFSLESKASRVSPIALVSPISSISLASLSALCLSFSLSPWLSFCCFLLSNFPPPRQTVRSSLLMEVMSFKHFSASVSDTHFVYYFCLMRPWTRHTICLVLLKQTKFFMSGIFVLFVLGGLNQTFNTLCLSGEI